MIYLDNAATSFPKPESVYLAARPFRTRSNRSAIPAGPATAWL